MKAADFVVSEDSGEKRLCLTLKEVPGSTFSFRLRASVTRAGPFKSATIPLGFEVKAIRAWRGLSPFSDRKADRSFAGQRHIGPLRPDHLGTDRRERD